jgi:hypothetical protein
MLERILAIVGAAGGILGTTAVPVVLAVINKRNKEYALGPGVPQATFGMTVDSASVDDARVARIELLAEVKADRDEAKAEVAELKSRLAAANAALVLLKHSVY